MSEIKLSKDQEKHAQVLCEKFGFIDLLCPANIFFTEEYIELIKNSGGITENITAASPYSDNLSESLCKIAEYHRLIENNTERLLLITKVDDITKAKESGRAGIILGLQGLNFISGFSKHSTLMDLGLIKILQMIGVRVVQPTYQYRNMLANGCGEEKDSGLSKLGVKAIAEMNQEGIVIDLSHMGKNSCSDTIELSKHPVIFSHSGVRSLADNVRNLSDETIKALADKGGVMGIVAYSPLVRLDAQPTLNDMLNHIDHVNKLVGIDHIGIGLDVYPPTPPEHGINFRRLFPEIGGGYPFTNNIAGIDSPELWPNIARGLLSRGYSDQEIGKILSGNALRIFNKVWKK